MSTRPVSWLICFSILTAVMSHPQETEASLSQSASKPGNHTSQTYGGVPLMFEANQGQANSHVKFLSHGNGYSVFLTASGMVLALPTSESSLPKDSTSLAENRNYLLRPTVLQRQKLFQSRRSSLVTIDLVGTAANVSMKGEDPLSTKVNYFIGRDPSKWQRNVPTYRTIRYSGVYPGIDLVYYGKNHTLEYDFEVTPGADPTKIEFSISGAEAVNIDSNGNLVLAIGKTTLLFQVPIIYQVADGARVPVAGSYVLRDATHVGFSIAVHDETRPVVIDPVLVYSTFIGGSSDDFSAGIAVDSSGHAYVVGLTDSPDFPLAAIGPYDPTMPKIYLAKLDPTGSTLIFADYFGGTTGNDGVSGVALDSLGNAYVTGTAASTDFPVVNAYQSMLSGSEDAFLAKFPADGSSISFSTYLGGSATAYGKGVAVDSQGEAVIAGITQSTDFPIVNAFQSSISSDQFGDWGEYGFITKFAADGQSLVYSSYLGGSNLSVSSGAGYFPQTDIMGLVVDSLGNAYVTGFTTTTNFPVTSGAFLTTYTAPVLGSTGFVSKFTNSGSISYSTYLPGPYNPGLLYGITVDSNGSAYVTGGDLTNQFPVTNKNICDPSVTNCAGSIVVKLDPTGSNLIYSTYVSTDNQMVATNIAVDESGNAFIGGSAYQFELVNPIEGLTGGQEVFIAEIDPAATTVLMATCLCGQQDDFLSGLVLDSSGALYVAGFTDSADFPVTQLAFQTLWAGGYDSFVAKIDPASNAPAATMGPSALQFGSQNVGSTSVAVTSVLRNMGSAALTIVSKNATGDFAETDDCGAVIAPASMCTFSITFTPTASGNRTGTLTIVDDAQGSPHTVALSGTGTGVASVSISPTFLRFQPTSIGRKGNSRVITLANTGSSDVFVHGMSVRGDFAAISYCKKVPAHGTCAVQVQFAPRASGIRKGSLQFNDSSGATQIVPLRGLGTDFSVSLENGVVAVRPGEVANYGLLVAPVAGPFLDKVSFTCVAAPAFSKCRVHPESEVPAENPQSVTVTLMTAGPSQYGPTASSSTVSLGSKTIPFGEYSFDVIARSGPIRHATKLNLIVH